MFVRRVPVRSLCAALALVFATAVLSACAPAPTDWQSEMVASVNAQRAAAGAPPLARCGTLERAAQAHSEDQAAAASMTHVGTDGSNLRTRVERSGYVGWNGIAENVAAGYADVPSVMDGWMTSSGHRANLLNPSYTHIGVGRAPSGSGAMYWTQDFGLNGAC